MLENEYTKIEPMTKAEISKVKANFKKPKKPHVLFAYKELNKVKNESNIFEFILPLDGSHSSDNVDQYLFKGYSIVSYQLPDINGDKDDRVINLARFLQRLEIAKEAGRAEAQAEAENPTEKRKARVKDSLEEGA